MVYLIYGQDTVKVNYYLDKIRLENQNSEEIVFNSSSFDKNFLTQNLATPPFLANNRILLFENLTDFSKIDFEKVHPKVTIVIVLRQDFKPRLANFDNLVVIEAKKAPLIFQFLDDLTQTPGKINLARLLKILQVEDKFFVFHQLATHFRRLILVKSDSFVGNLANWQIAKYRRICQKTTLEKLKIAHKLLLATEITVKTQGKDLSFALPILIVRLTQIFKNP